MISGQRLSITTGSLNRLEPLRQSLATWLSHPEPDEVIIVDWGNRIPLLESLHDFIDPRIIIARAENQKFWHNSKCHNLELQLTSSEQLLRLDSDCLLGPTFFEKHVLENDCFFAGDWQDIPIEIDDKRNLTGTLYVHVSDVRAVNGYNERLAHYGYEDDDLYHRLAAKGLKRNNIDLSTVEHISHSDAQRYENLEIASQLPHPTASKQIREKIAFNVKRNLTQMSRTIATNSPWTTRDHMTEWRTQKMSSNYYICEEISKSKPREPLMYVDAVSPRR